MNHTYYFYGAYFVFWMSTLVYLFTIDRRQKRLADQVSRLSSETND